MNYEVINNIFLQFVLDFGSLLVIIFRFRANFDSDMSVFDFSYMLLLDYTFSVGSRLLNLSRLLFFGISLQMC